MKTNECKSEYIEEIKYLLQVCVSPWRLEGGGKRGPIKTFDEEFEVRRSRKKKSIRETGEEINVTTAYLVLPLDLCRLWALVSHLSQEPHKTLPTPAHSDLGLPLSPL